jgi:Zn-dependent peptidase ImmA (M78 family)
LGHMIMHVEASGTMETEANQFAASFLMPEGDIKAHLGEMTMEKAANMKPYWRVSMAAIIRRAYELECMSEERYMRIFMHYAKLGYKQSEPITIPGENPQLINKLLETYSANGFTSDEMAKLIHLEVDEYQSWYVKNTAMRMAQ